MSMTPLASAYVPCRQRVSSANCVVVPALARLGLLHVSRLASAPPPRGAFLSRCFPLAEAYPQRWPSGAGTSKRATGWARKAWRSALSIGTSSCPGRCGSSQAPTMRPALLRPTYMLGLLLRCRQPEDVMQIRRGLVERLSIALDPIHHALGPVLSRAGGITFPISSYGREMHFLVRGIPKRLLPPVTSLI
jgi:hypothetical protein